MRHRKAHRKLNRTSSHRIAMLRNMATSLFENERINTTAPKAKELRSFAERLITLAKKGDLNSRRLAAKDIKKPEVLQKLFDDVGQRVQGRPGGYTRVLKTGFRKGDNAMTALIELVDRKAVSTDAE